MLFYLSILHMLYYMFPAKVRGSERVNTPQKIRRNTYRHLPVNYTLDGDNPLATSLVAYANFDYEMILGQETRAASACSIIRILAFLSFEFERVSECSCPGGRTCRKSN